MTEPWPVPRWPDFLERAGIGLAAVDTPFSPIRDPARQQVRAALAAAVRRLDEGQALAEPLRWIDRPGQAPRLDDPRAAAWGIALSHEVGLSLFALRPAGPVGLDLLRLDAVPAARAERCRLAADYLGAAALGTEALTFARAWAGHEAALKCRGLPLAEWTPGLARELQGVCRVELALPAGFVGALVWPEAAPDGALSFCGVHCAAGGGRR